MSFEHSASVWILLNLPHGRSAINGGLQAHFQTSDPGE
jgi:hypothetical protein